MKATGTQLRLRFSAAPRLMFWPAILKQIRHRHAGAVSGNRETIDGHWISYLKLVHERRQRPGRGLHTTHQLPNYF